MGRRGTSSQSDSFTFCSLSNNDDIYDEHMQVSFGPPHNSEHSTKRKVKK